MAGNVDLKEKKAFTIIEILIVLAIAGLIMLIVLVAIPQLQRNQRNTARKNVAGRIKVEVDAFVGNNQTNPPSSDNNAATGILTGGGFYSRYLSGVNLKDPSTGSNMVTAPWTADNAVSTVGTIYYVTGRICDKEASTAVGAVAKNYVLMLPLEGGAVLCLDNK